MAVPAGAGFFLVFGHLFIFMAYRSVRTDAVAPFYRCFTFRAVTSDFLVFGQLPDLMRCFLLSGVSGALAGLLYSGMMQTVRCSFGTGAELAAIAAAILAVACGRPPTRA